MKYLNEATFMQSSGSTTTKNLIQLLLSTSSGRHASRMLSQSLAMHEAEWVPVLQGSLHCVLSQDILLS